MSMAIAEIDDAPAPPNLRPLAPPVTLCVVCYGSHAGLARRFLESLYACTDPSLFSLRAGLNEVEPETRRLFERYASRHGNVDVVIEPRNVFKNPMMRRLFHERPLTSRWTLWCDDDTHFTQTDWLPQLARQIDQHPGVAMWGSIHYILCQHPSVLDWIRRATWYRSLPFPEESMPDGTRTPRFEFATGGFWALRTEVLHALNWPDPRLIHAGEDVLLGEALRQNGHLIGDFTSGVCINDAPRRNADAREVSQLPQ